MPPTCGEFPWKRSAADTQLFRGAVHELEYRATGAATGFPFAVPVPEEAPLFFLLQNRPGMAVRRVKIEPLSIPVRAKVQVVALEGGPADRVWQGTIQPPALGRGDVVMNLHRFRYCGTVTEEELAGTVSDAENRVERIESGEEGGLTDTIRSALGTVRTVGVLAAVAGVAVLVAVLMSGAADARDLIGGSS